MNNQKKIVNLQEAAKILYWYSREDYIGNYPSRQYDEDIKREQEIAADFWKLLQEEISLYYYNL